MKKTFAILVVLAAYILLTRFIMVDNPVSAGPAPAFPCDEGVSSFSCSTLERLNQSYLSEIKPIFQQKCLMCHGVVEKVPLYAKVPPSKWLVEYDQRTAKRHVNMSWDFPFRSHKGLGDALEEIEEVMKDGSMPPFIYKILHWNAGIKSSERQKILTWVAMAQAALAGPQ